MENTLADLAAPNLDMLSFEQIKAAHARAEALPAPDPILARAELPLSRTFYPFGFPLQISTNSEEILALADECWHDFHQLFDIPPIRFHLGITTGGTSECPPAPITRLREHLCSHVADPENFGVSDALSSFSFIWLTQSTLAHRNYVRYFFLESGAMFHLAARYSIPIHAGCVELDGAGVLLCGDSGAGKSTLSYACARAGWTYITDDASFLVNGRDDGLIVGNGRMARFRPSAEALFPELRGRPVLQRSEIGKPSIELTTTLLQNVRTAFSSQARHLVFLNRRPGLAPELVPLQPEIARAFILQNRIGVAEVERQQTAVLDRLLERGVYELRYADLDWAIDRLTSLVREG
jgi:hypothetical protein